MTLEPIVLRYIFQCLTDFKLNLSQVPTKSDLLDYSTNYNYQLVVPIFRVNKIKNWFDVVAVTLFNKLIPETQSINNMIFKTSLRSRLISHPCYQLNEFSNEHVYILFLD